MIKSFSLLIKPASADCNLCCPYCFYLSKSKLYPETNVHRMDDRTLERLIQSYLETSQTLYSFCWQGGEPTLMGVEFFKKVIDLQMKYSQPGAIISNSLQTNAILVTDELAKLFRKYNFLVGVSLDGPKEIHNKYRMDRKGKGSYEKVLNGIECLKRNKVEFNILILVTKENVNKGKEVYNYLKNLGFYYQQYIPSVEFNEEGMLLPYAITGEDWGTFLCDIFDEWKKEDTKRISVRLFDSITQYLVNGIKTVCAMNDVCNSYFVVEYNGDVYPCDFFVEESLKLGNIMENTWEEIQNSSEYIEFGQQKSQWNQLCADCKYLEFCAGDCIKFRLPIKNNPRTLSSLCNGWRHFYAYTLEELKKITLDFLREKEMELVEKHRNTTFMSHFSKMGRNAPCPCGSGKKFKQCCGKKGY